MHRDDREESTRPETAHFTSSCTRRVLSPFDEDDNRHPVADQKTSSNDEERFLISLYS